VAVWYCVLIWRRAAIAASMPGPLSSDVIVQGSCGRDRILAPSRIERCILIRPAAPGEMIVWRTARLPGPHITLRFTPHNLSEPCVVHFDTGESALSCPSFSEAGAPEFLPTELSPSPAHW
jgi:hypothetical protein